MKKIKDMAFVRDGRGYSFENDGVRALIFFNDFNVKRLNIGLERKREEGLAVADEIPNEKYEELREASR